MASRECLRFMELPLLPGRTTPSVEVHSASSGDLLGWIHWHGPWRQFVYSPRGDTIYSAGCMSQINSEIGRLMGAWRARMIAETRARSVERTGE